MECNKIKKICRRIKFDDRDSHDKTKFIDGSEKINMETPEKNTLLKRMAKFLLTRLILLDFITYLQSHKTHSIAKLNRFSL